MVKDGLGGMGFVVLSLGRGVRARLEFFFFLVPSPLLIPVTKTRICFWAAGFFSFLFGWSCGKDEKGLSGSQGGRSCFQVGENHCKNSR